MATVFINYRTGDGQDMATLLETKLAEVFGPDQVFLDSKGLPPGRPFPEELHRRLRECAVLLVLIGDNWLSVRDGNGNRRIDGDEDYVRVEIRESIRRSKVVLPILLNAAPLPSRDELPPDIALLSLFQFRRLRARESTIDLPEIIRVVGEHVPRLGAPPAVLPRTGDTNHASAGTGAAAAGSGATANYYGSGTVDRGCGHPGCNRGPESGHG